MRKWLLRAVVALVFVFVVAAVGFVAWAGTPSGALLPTVPPALESGAGVTVSNDHWLTFAPADSDASRTGFIFYPGGRVLAEAYAPVLRQIAEAGYLVVAPAMPLNLAVLAPETASKVMDAHPEIEHWVIGGHSLGGAMAATYAHAHPERVDGLVLWASYPQDSDSLAETGMTVASIYGTLDGVASLDNIDASRGDFPTDAAFVAIEGGNHAQFGDYGDQSGDNPATITRAEQQVQAAAATLTVLAAVSN